MITPQRLLQILENLVELQLQLERLNLQFQTTNDVIRTLIIDAQTQNPHQIEQET